MIRIRMPPRYYDSRHDRFWFHPRLEWRLTKPGSAHALSSSHWHVRLLIAPRAQREAAADTPPFPHMSHPRFPHMSEINSLFYRAIAIRIVRSLNSRLVECSIIVIELNAQLLIAIWNVRSLKSRLVECSIIVIELHAITTNCNSNRQISQLTARRVLGHRN